MSNQLEQKLAIGSPDVVVIGAGLAGLTAAALVAKAGRSVVVQERRGVAGGDATSVVRDGFTFNQGPHAVYRGGDAERVLLSAGVKLRGGQPSTKGRLVFDRRAEIAPAGPFTLMQTKALGLRAKFEIGKLLGGLPRLDPKRLGEVSVDEWVGQVCSEARSAEMLHAITRLATYCNQPESLSAEVAVTQLQLALGKGVLYLDGGWQSLVDQLVATPGVEIVMDAGVDEVPDAPAVIIAAGGPRTAEKLTGRTFDSGPAAHVSCIDLGLRRRPDEDLVIGGDVPFYFSNHSSVANLAPEGQFHAAVLQYLSGDEQPDAEAAMAFTKYAGVREDDVVVSRTLHRMTPVTAMATAEQGGFAGRPKVTDSGLPNVFIAGDWVGPSGHLADASLASAEVAAHAAVAVVESRRSHATRR